MRRPVAHDVAKGEPPFQPTVRQDPDDAADRDRGREQAEPDRAHPEALVGVEDEHGPGGAERDVEREDRQGQRPHRRVREQPADALAHLGPEARPRAAARPSRSMTTRDTSSAPSTKQMAFVANGRAMPTANRNAPIGGATSWFVSRKAPCIRAFADAQVLAGDETGQQRAARGVGERLGGAEDEQRDRARRRC